MHFLYFKDLYDLIAEVDGDIVECGVGYGDSLYKLRCLVYYDGKGRRIYGFDSFEGFPEPSAEDRSPRNPRKGEWKVSTVEKIYQVLMSGIERDFIRDNVILVKGFFDESLPNYEGEKNALLHLDVDLYRSHKVTLEYFWPRVAQGGVVLFDEYRNSLTGFPGAISTLAGGIAHDFNNLLMGIFGNVSLMQMEIDPGNPLYNRLINIEKQVQGGSHLTKQLLGFARGKYDIKPIDINDLIKKTSEMFGRPCPRAANYILRLIRKNRLPLNY